MNKLFIIPILFILLLFPIYAPPTCWEAIDCSISGTPLPDASIIYPDYSTVSPFEEYCTISGIRIIESPNHLIEIELIQGGYKDSHRNQSWIIGETTESVNDPIYFYINKSVSPVYLNCYWLHPTSVNSYNINPSRIELIQTWTASYDGGYFDYLNPVPKANELTVTNEVTFANGLNIVSSGTIKLLNTLTQNTTNYPANSSNPFILAIAWFFMIFGLIGFILLITLAHDKEWY